MRNISPVVIISIVFIILFFYFYDGVDDKFKDKQQSFKPTSLNQRQVDAKILSGDYYYDTAGKDYNYFIFTNKGRFFVNNKGFFNLDSELYTTILKQTSKVCSLIIEPPSSLNFKFIYDWRVTGIKCKKISDEIPQ